MYYVWGELASHKKLVVAIYNHVYTCRLTKKVHVHADTKVHVWEELASHKRYLTHRPNSQGWASRCSLLYNIILNMLICLGYYVTLPFFLFCKSQCAEHRYFHEPVVARKQVNTGIMITDQQLNCSLSFNA